jgi:hypothetical protein
LGKQQTDGGGIINSTIINTAVTINIIFKKCQMQNASMFKMF